jgi:hypothetical protein
MVQQALGLDLNKDGTDVALLDIAALALSVSTIYVENVCVDR